MTAAAAAYSGAVAVGASVVLPEHKGEPASVCPPLEARIDRTKAPEKKKLSNLE